MDREWAIYLSVVPQGEGKEVKTKFNNKHLVISSLKPAIPRKGENKPDIEQNVQGAGIWFLVKQAFNISIPNKGDLNFRVTCDGSVSGNYELPYVKNVQSINWHAEKHITKQRDYVFLRIENKRLVCVRVFIPEKYIPAPNTKQDAENSGQSTGTKKKLSLGLPKSADKANLPPSSLKSASKLSISDLQKESKKADIPKPVIATESPSQTNMKVIAPSSSISRENSNSLKASNDKKSIKSESSLSNEKLKDFTPAGYNTPIKEETDQAISGISPIQFALPKASTPIRRSGSKTSALEEIPSSPILNESPSPSPPPSPPPPTLKRTPSKITPSPAKMRKALQITKLRRSLDRSTIHIDEEEKPRKDGVELQHADAVGVMEDEDMIEEIVVHEKYFVDSDEEAPKPKRKRRKSNQESEKENKKLKTEDDQKEKGAEENKTPSSSQDKSKKRRKKVIEIIDVEELQRKRELEGFSGEQLQVVADVKVEDKKPKKTSKEKDNAEKKDGKKDGDKKKKDAEKKGKKDGDKKKDKSEKVEEKPSAKEKKEETIIHSHPPAFKLADLDDLSSSDDFEATPPAKKQKNPPKKKDRKATQQNKPTLEKKQSSFIDIMNTSEDEAKSGDDMELLSSEDEKKKKGERLKYSSTLEAFENKDEDEETSDYEYSGMDLLEGSFDGESSTPIRSTPTVASTSTSTTTAPAVGPDGVAAAPPADGEEGDDGQVHNKEEALLYSVYRPKVDANIYCAHPANVVEAHTLASIVLPDCDYSPSLPSICFSAGGLSSLQLETVAMVGMRHGRNLPNSDTRAGYFIGDGTGVGKGRQIAAIFADNFMKGRKKGIWFSVSNTLYKDARRDLTDIGCGEGEKNYIPLLEMPHKASESVPSKGVLFATYSTLVSKGGKGSQSRFDQIMKWCGKDFEGVIVFDEGHAAKNLRPGKSSSLTGQKVFDIQEKLPRARVVYVSATGATEPHHMAYMTRLGLWGADTEFHDFKSFAKQITDAGVGAMEMVAMEMKGRGIYCSRYLSFEGTSFDIFKHSLTPKEEDMYNKAVKVWDDILKVAVESRSARVLVWAAHQRFFLHVILATKVADCVSMVKAELARGCAVVIGLFSTGESLVGEEKEGDSEELFSAPQHILLNLVDKITLDAEGNTIPDMIALRASFERDIKALELPENPLDKLIDELGGIKKVAEMTGRRKRFVRRKNGYQLESRDAKAENLSERDRFQKGEKLVAIISDAASMGISLQSDRSCKNRKQRVHIILQLPWAADKAVQQLGRTHRSHQVTPPQYRLIITNLGGEWRLASTIAARLASLGALTNADRRAAAASKSLSKFLLQPKYTLDALASVENELQSNPASEAILKKFRFMECNAGGTSQKAKKFLNRLLGFSIDSQQTIFDLFMNQYERQVMQAQKEGRFDDGVYDLQGELMSGPEVVFQSPVDANQTTERFVIAIDRGVKWKKAIQFLRDADKTKQGTTIVESSLRNGFYKHLKSGQVVLAIQRLDSKHYFHICKPHIGHQRGYMTRSDLKSDYKLIQVKAARKLWDFKYENADGEGKGQRMVLQTIIVGSILPIFSRLVSTLDGDKIQIVRALCGEKRLVGVHIQQEHVKPLVHNLNMLENELRAKLRKDALMQHLASQGIGNVALEMLPVSSLQAFLGIKTIEHTHSGQRRKRKQQIEQYSEGEETNSISKENKADYLSSHRMEDVAADVVEFLGQRISRQKELYALIEATNIPNLAQYNAHLCQTYVHTEMGTTAKSIVETLIQQFKSYLPRLQFLRKHLENAPAPIHYQTVLDLYVKENPKASSTEIVAILSSLPREITHVHYQNMEYLVWKP